MITGEVWLTSCDIPEITSEIGVVLRVSPDYKTTGKNIRSVRVIPRDRLLFYDGQEFKRQECRGSGWLTLSFHVRYAVCFGIILDRHINERYLDVALKISNYEYRQILSHAIRRWVIDGLGTAIQTYEVEPDDVTKEVNERNASGQTDGTSKKIDRHYDERP